MRRLWKEVGCSATAKFFLSGKCFLYFEHQGDVCVVLWAKKMGKYCKACSLFQHSSCIRRRAVCGHLLLHLKTAVCFKAHELAVRASSQTHRSCKSRREGDIVPGSREVVCSCSKGSFQANHLQHNCCNTRSSSLPAPLWWYSGRTLGVHH